MFKAHILVPKGTKRSYKPPTFHFFSPTQPPTFFYLSDVTTAFAVNFDFLSGFCACHCQPAELILLYIVFMYATDEILKYRLNESVARDWL